MLRDELKKEIAKITGLADVKISEPERSEYGDFTTNAAFRHGNADEIARALRKNSLVEKVEVKNKFINIFLKDEAILKELDAKISFPKKKEKFSVEYLDANPTGPVHLGHARSGFYGDALSKVLTKLGYKVTREFYVNNARASLQIRSLGRTALGRGEEYRHEQLNRLLKNPKIQKQLEKISDESEAGFLLAKFIHKENETLLKEKAKIVFDVFFEEESLYESGAVKRVLGTMGERGVTHKKEGALWFRASEYGDTEARVLVRSTGEPTYLLPDIAYHLNRIEERKHDFLINIFGADHHGYGTRLLGALRAIGVNTARISIMNVQIVRFMEKGKEVKMSKRRGVFITLEELLEEVGLNVCRWFFLERSLSTHLDFNLDLAKERSEKNPVYYVQYALVRMQSILEKSAARNSKLQKEFGHKAERDLAMKILRYPEILEDISRDYQAHRLTTYAYELAQTFSAFYRDVKVLGSKREGELLYLVARAKETLADVLKLLGVSQPEKM